MNTYALGFISLLLRRLNKSKALPERVIHILRPCSFYTSSILILSRDKFGQGAEDIAFESTS
jgi:hypothetical protein